MSDLHIKSRINDVLYEIHRDITLPHRAATLAKRAAFSESHFHRVFAQVVGEPVHQYIRRIRLEQAANQLMFEAGASVAEIANKCGFHSLSSFSRAFKTHFSSSPGAWRMQDRKFAHARAPYLRDPEIRKGYQRVKDRPLPPPFFETLDSVSVVYIRHQGYGRSITQAWRLLEAWARERHHDFSSQIGLHHSNPAWVPLEKCRYVACLESSAGLRERGLVNQMEIPGGLHACFHLTGQYGDLLPFLSKILGQWFPQSGFKLKATPGWVRYKENQFLSTSGAFDLVFYLPVGLY